MAQVLSPGGVKPKQWRVRKGRIASEWRWAWDEWFQNPYIFVPAWEKGGTPRSLLTASAAATWTGSWGRTKWGASFSFDGTADNAAWWTEGIPTDIRPYTGIVVFRINDLSTATIVQPSLAMETADPTGDSGLYGFFFQWHEDNLDWRHTIGGIGHHAILSTPAVNTTDLFLMIGGNDGADFGNLLVRNLSTGDENTGSGTVTGWNAPSAGGMGFGQWEEQVGTMDVLWGGVFPGFKTLAEQQILSRMIQRAPFGPFRPERRTVVSVPAAAPAGDPAGRRYYDHLLAGAA